VAALIARPEISSHWNSICRKQKIHGPRWLTLLGRPPSPSPRRAQQCPHDSLPNPAPNHLAQIQRLRRRTGATWPANWALKIFANNPRHRLEIQARHLAWKPSLVRGLLLPGLPNPNAQIAHREPMLAPEACPMKVRLATLHNARRVGLRTKADGTGTKAGATKADAMKADAMNLDATKAGVTHPEPTHPEPTNLGETKPEATNPGAMNPDATNPGETDLKVPRMAKDAGDVAAVVVVDEEAEIAATLGRATRTGVRVRAVAKVPQIIERPSSGAQTIGGAMHATAVLANKTAPSVPASRPATNASMERHPAASLANFRETTGATAVLPDKNSTISTHNPRAEAIVRAAYATTVIV